MDEEELNYDDKFDIYDNFTEPVKEKYRYANTPSTEVARGDFDFGDSRYDKAFFPNVTVNEDGNLRESISENRAQRQPWITKAGAGILRIGTKVVSEVAKMPGVIGGVVFGGFGQIGDIISGEDNTDFIQTAFNNSWIRAIGDAEEYIKSEALPVYVKKAVSEGNLWDNITAIDFWATEGADGIGYIVSMLVPGAAINKFGIAAKILGTNKYAQMAAKTKYADDILKQLKRIDSPLTPTSAKNADLFTGTMANTLFEAGAEAKGAMDSYEQELQQKLANNEITQEQYNNELKKSSEIGRNVFLANAAILIGPNAMMSKMLWGKPRNKAVGVIAGTGRLEALNNPTLRQKAGQAIGQFIKGSVTEGLWEEGMQSASEQFFVNNPDAGFLDSVGEIPKAYAEMFSSTDGQKAMFLGTLFGGGMTSYQDFKSSTKEKNITNQLITAGNEVLDDAYNIFHKDTYEKNEDGQVIFDEILENGEYKKVPKVNFKALAEKIKSSNQLEYLSGLYDLASESGDVELVRDIKQKVFTDLIKPFIVNEQLGIDVLRQHLETSSELASLNKADKTDNKKFIDNILEQAKKLEKDNTLFQSFAPSIFDLNNPEANANDKVAFYNKLTDIYLNNKSNQYYNQQKLQEKKATFNTLLEERGINYIDVENNPAKVRDLSTIDNRIGKIYNEIGSLNNKLRDIDKLNNAFWDNKSVKEAFSKEVKEANKIRKEQDSIEKETTDVLEKINLAKTLDELDDINIPENIASESIKETLNSKRKEIQSKISENSKKVSEKNAKLTLEEQEKDRLNEEALNYLSNNFNVGETVTIPDVKGIPENRRGLSAEITAIKKGYISFKTEDGQEFAFKPTTFTAAINTSNFVTEGPIEDIIEEVQEDISTEIYEEKNQPRIIITDNNKGKKLSFISDAALEFERTPRDKTNEEKGIEVNKQGFSDNQKKALELFNNKDFTDIEFLINHLPLNIKLTDDIFAPLETKSDKEGYNKIFNKTSKELRSTIIKELAKGTKIEDISVPIVGQGNGTLQIEDNVVENLITGLYEFSGDISKIKKEDIYFVDNFGTLININDDIFPVNRRLAKGEVYLKIHTAAGLDFPLKLNIKKLTKDKAELLYELYKNRFNGEETNTLSSLDKELWNKIQVNFKDVLDLLNKNINDITIKDLIEFLVWEGSKNPKTQVKFTIKNTLLLFDKELTKEQFETPESKDLFIYTLTQNKRHQIKFRKKETDNNNLNIDENRAYLEYLINSGTLNTNAKIGEPTFQGKTTIYLGKDQVKIKGKLSEFNEDLIKIYKTKVAKPKVETIIKTETPKEKSGKFKGIEITDTTQIDALSELFGPPTIVSSKKEEIEKPSLKEETEFSKLTDEQASKIYIALSKNYVVHIKEIQIVAKKYNKIQDKVKAVFDLLKNKDISEEQIKTKCGL